MKQSVAILANGSLNIPLVQEKISSFSYLIAADGGLVSCHQMGLVPDLILGDFDSCPKKLLDFYPQAEKKSYPRNKDFSDLELCLQIAKDMGFESAVAFGALGKRIDHSLYNLQMLIKYPFLKSLEEGSETVFLLPKKIKLSCQIGRTLSLFSAFAPATHIYTSGCRWDLQNATFNHHFMSLSNEALFEEIYIEYQEGFLFCALQQDADLKQDLS
jgi:thiamine pyrophosphokinase